MKHTDAARGRSRGFTLVEMLIVIIIIGILAGMMMLSTGAATDKAEATRIVSDMRSMKTACVIMRSMKTACVMYYADSGEWPEAINASFDKYLDVPVSDNDDYSLTTSENVLWLSYKGGKLAEGNGVSERLAAMAKETGLYASASAEPDDPDYSGGAEVFMIVKK